jgi:hypothetical protein
MSLRYVLFDTSLFERGSDERQARTNLTWLLESLTQLDQAYLKDHPDTPRLYNSGVVYSAPQQFNGDCDEVRILKSALGVKAIVPEVAAALDSVQQVMGGERFRDIGRIIERGSTDCDGIAAFRAAELRQAGIQASPYITWRQRPDGGWTYHVLVRWPGQGDEDDKRLIEDPSLLLGMGGEARAADRQVEIEKNKARVAAVAAKANAKGPSAAQIRQALATVAGGRSR